MDFNRQKEEFSNAFIQAVAATAGFGLARPWVDDDSVDWSIAQAGGSGTVRSPRLDLQLKSSSSVQIRDDVIPFPLKIKNYEDLRATNCLVPRILVVVLLPKEVDDWLELSDEQLVMRHCAYWMSLCGMEEVENESRVTVKVPIEQKFDTQSLSTIMELISKGERP